MSSAPPFVSLPWSMTTSLTAFVMSDLDATNNAVDGLKEVTGVLANYSYVEGEFLRNDLTREDFGDIVLPLYTAIFEYQARAVQYFGRSTLKRFGLNTLTAEPWAHAIDKVRNLERTCQISIQALSSRLNRDHKDIRNGIGDEHFESGQWLLTHETVFGSWKNAQHGILVLKGVVGSGKTSVTSMVIQQLLAKGQLAFFYCSANASPHNPTGTAHDVTSNIFQSILAQCSIHLNGTVSEKIRVDFDKSDRKSPGGCDMTLGLVMSKLKEILQERENEQHTCVFDALDECKDHSTFLSCVAELMKAVPKLRVFVSTRFGIDVSDYFEEHRVLSIGSHNIGDIDTYVEKEISKRGTKLSPLQSDRLQKALVRHSEGVFRWVVLEMDLFFPRTKHRLQSPDIDRRLDKLENSRANAVERLFQAYEEIYQNALGDSEDETGRHIVKSAMKWVLCSFIQLNGYCLEDAVSISPDGTEQDIFAITILEYCGNFIVRVSDYSIKLAHLSVRQFFEDRKGFEFSPPQQHLHVALSCVHLVLNAFNGNWVHISMLPYAERYWPIHCRVAGARPAIMSMELSRLGQSRLDRSTYPYSVNPLLFHIASGGDLISADDLGNSLMHFMIMQANISGLYQLLRVDPHLERLRLLSHKNKAGNLPVHLAALRSLIAAGSKIDVVNRNGQTPCHTIVMLEFYEMTQWIAQLGQEIYDEHRNSLLHYAAFFNNTSAIRLLVEAGWDKDARNCDDNTPLHLAAYGESLAAYQTLVSIKASPQLVNAEGELAADLFSRSTYEVTGIDSVTSSTLITLDSISCDRPRIIIDDPEINSCSYCDLGRWLDPSQQGLQHDFHNPHIRRTPGRSDCRLCFFFYDIIMGLCYEAGEFYQIRARLHSNIRNVDLGRDILILTSANAEIEVELCVDAEESCNYLAGDVLPGRMLAEENREKHNASIISQWIRDCHLHQVCSKPIESTIPRRLIDVGLDPGAITPRIIDTEDLPNLEDVNFVYLCHTNSAYVDDEDNFNAARPNFSKPIQDAMRLCSNLGYKYLLSRLYV
ncbi:hypothetical protein BDV95DRAFT_667282 [Massariosphaeria phaeospora]|uniref:Nephrocystin 3-like N-terminal domain-containing protein n=1 Tax=Massariosphaeria phaeospora TaxID=100035 RepID=A0A7C8MCK0_9PLEO|nr:hypothetical protein BDV95DRAFT_667282 [Massariosphaeria phaeospora]